MRGLPEPWHGATVVHLSDLHCGFGGTDPVYEEAVERVNALQPDLIVFTGDYIDDRPVPADYPLVPLLRRFSARHGLVATFGNHDHRRGVHGTRRLLEQAGARILDNESVRLEGGLWLAGIDDLFEGKPDLRRTLADVPPEATTLLLSHNPSLINKVPDRDVLILSGHTHGGQIALPILTPKLVCLFHLHVAQVAGWYRNGRARLYVNRGLGVTGRPFRYHCPAEIGVFRLVPDTADGPRREADRRPAAEPVGRR